MSISGTSKEPRPGTGEQAASQGAGLEAQEADVNYSTQGVANKCLIKTFLKRLEL